MSLNFQFLFRSKPKFTLNFNEKDPIDTRFDDFSIKTERKRRDQKFDKATDIGSPRVAIKLLDEETLRVDKCQEQARKGKQFDSDGKISRLTPKQRQSSVSGQPNNQFNAQHEHHTSVPFCNNTALKKGNVVRGILCPSLTNSFR